ncbi:N-acetyl-gamma-glutamyl-phosphate reductase [Paenactinomyces guangxiensis]|uniref:N-acetyl-gamma-glutamyl-phosphate reductase n=1 Tax=Paenactinomyces guangxiensis TaxID=1490290 RepID=A0A7W1WSR4_9BACL|nr:N-acetyl-gamma-glutamyl-phosphate reductase [Paenactinomyces guangxiensis]MBA4495352.1 N-acetyl-gamma-glutamyl-phosphate reductase [Paenactinomyces guangxiensis]MBH8592527.1 N-acetyl-gamma-glutamyl-phosphate reductase [Paenactinomyces guangxiensis]
MKAAIVGSTGYGGVELVRLLQNHPYLELGTLISSSQSGEPLSQAYPHLSHLPFSFDTLEIEHLCKNAEVIFFATPPGVSSKWVPQLLEQGKAVIDLSGDFRLNSPEVYEEWYQIPSAPAEWLNQAVYGLSEWFREEIQTAQLISNPGCYPTATLLALAPLLQAGIISASSIIIDAKSGVTGAGRSVKQSMLYSEVNENLRPYKVDGHQHIPEIERFASQLAQEKITVSFVPHLVPMNRGILVTIYAQVLNNYTSSDVQEVYRQAYQEAPFIRLKQNEWPQTKFVQGSNYCDIGFHVDERTGRLVVLSAIDNLMKGAAGQAVQNANIRMGWPEDTGLHYVPLYP